MVYLVRLEVDNKEDYNKIEDILYKNNLVTNIDILEEYED